MERWSSRAGRGDPRKVLHPQVTLAVLTALAGLPLAATAALVPAPLVLPTISLLALAAAAAIAVVAWRRRAPRGGNAITAWDAAGALALIGFVAATLADPQHVVSLMEATTATQ